MAGMTHNRSCSGIVVATLAVGLVAGCSGGNATTATSPTSGTATSNQTQSAAPLAPSATGTQSGTVSGGTASPSAPATSSATTTVAPAKNGIVISDGMVLGGVQGGTFVGADKVLKLAAKGTVMDALNVTGQAGSSVRSTGVDGPSEICEGYGVGLSPNADKPRLVVTHGLARTPRPVTTVTPSEENLAALKALLVSQKITSEPAVVQAVQADLDGDGSPEQVITAEKLLLQNGRITPTVRAGDYAVVAVFRSGKLVKALAQEYHLKSENFAAPQRFGLDTVADLNGDGSMEVAIWGGYYEGSSGAVFALRGGVPTQVMGAACGA